MPVHPLFSHLWPPLHTQPVSSPEAGSDQTTLHTRYAQHVVQVQGHRPPSAPNWAAHPESCVQTSLRSLLPTALSTPGPVLPAHLWGQPGTRNHRMWTFLAPGVSSDSFTWASRPGDRSSAGLAAPSPEGWAAAAGPSTKGTGNRQRTARGPKSEAAWSPQKGKQLQRGPASTGAALRVWPCVSGCMGEGGGPQAEPQQYPWRHSLIPTAVLTGGRLAILKLVRETLQLSAHTAAIHNRASPTPAQPRSPACPCLAHTGSS